MQRSKVAGLVIALIILFVGVPALVWATSSGGDDHRRPGISRMHDGDRGHGPPSWAHGRHAMSEKGANPWQALTPEQRSLLMRGLAREHRKCMLAGDKCVAPQRDECDGHMGPPGLAKRR